MAATCWQIPVIHSTPHSFHFSVILGSFSTSTEQLIKTTPTIWHEPSFTYLAVSVHIKHNWKGGGICVSFKIQVIIYKTAMLKQIHKPRAQSPDVIHLQNWKLELGLFMAGECNRKGTDMCKNCADSKRYLYGIALQLLYQHDSVLIHI